MSDDRTEPVRVYPDEIDDPEKLRNLMAGRNAEMIERWIILHRSADDQRPE